MRPQGSEKKQTDEDRKLDRLLSASSLLLSILCCIAIFHMELRIQEHRRLISHSSSGTFRDEMETEILRKVQQQCGSWRQTKDSNLKGDWQTTTLCYLLCSLYLFAMRYRFSSVSRATPAKFYFFSNCISDPKRQQKYLSTVCRVEGLTVHDYNFFYWHCHLVGKKYI